MKPDWGYHFSGFSRPSSLLIKNCPLSPTKKARKSLRWTPELASLRRQDRRLFNRCRADNMSSSWKLYSEAQRRYRKEVRKAPERPGRPSLAPSMIYIGRLGRIVLYLETLKPSWDPWWHLPDSVRNPNGKPWIFYLSPASPTQMVWKGAGCTPLPAVPHVWIGGWLPGSSPIAR